MSALFELDSLWLVEGVGSDAVGTLSAIGLHQNILLTEKLPARTKRALIGHLIVPSPPEGVSLHFKFRVIAPDGREVLEQDGQLTLGRPRYSDLPATVVLPFETIIEVDAYGAYEINLTVEGQGEKAERSVTLYVRKPDGDTSPDDPVSPDREA